MPNIGFATISVIPSFEGLQTRLRLGVAVPLGKVGKKAGEDAGKDFTRELERNIKPDLDRAGRDAGKDFARAVENAGAPDLRAQGKRAGDSFADGVSSLPPPDLSSQGTKAGTSFADKLTGSIDTAAKGGLAAAGVAAGALIVTSILKGMDTEAVSDKLVASLGGGSEAKAAGGVAGELYTEGFGDSVADTAAAVRDVLLFGLIQDNGAEGATPELIERLSTQALTFADVLDQDLRPSIRAVSTLIRTGLARNAIEGFDILTRGIQKGADLGDDLLDTFNEYPTSFRELGLSGADAMGLLVQGLRAGARNSDFLADALKEFGIRGQDASELSRHGFELLGIDADKATKAIAAGGAAARDALSEVLTALANMEDPVARNAAAVALFGTKAEDLGDALFALDLPTAAAQLGETAGATDELGTAYDNAKSKVESFKREAMEDLTIFMADSVIPALQTMGNTVDDVSQKFFDAAAFGITHFIDALERIPLVNQIANDVAGALGIGEGDPNDPAHLQVLQSFENDRRPTLGRRSGLGSYRAMGGEVFGPRGTDKVPIWATAGEFVMQKDAVDKFGIPFMQFLNAGGFADGGAVVKYGEVTPTVWNELFRIGWRGRPNDGMEALYPPAGDPLVYDDGSVRGGSPIPGSVAWWEDNLNFNGPTPIDWDAWGGKGASKALRDIMQTVAPPLRAEGSAGSFYSGPEPPSPWSAPADWAGMSKDGDIHLNVTQYPGEDQVSAGMRALRWHQQKKTLLAARG